MASFQPFVFGTLPGTNTSHLKMEHDGFLLGPGLFSVATDGNKSDDHQLRLVG